MVVVRGVTSMLIVVTVRSVTSVSKTVRSMTEAVRSVSETVRSVNMLDLRSQIGEKSICVWTKLLLVLGMGILF